MNFTLRSSSSSFNENERLTRKRQSTTTTTNTLNRFLSFNENKSSSVENRRRLLQSTPNLIELLEEDDEDIDDNQALCHECSTCSKIFASEYGLNHHINMHHPNQSILCSICNLTFRSHRSLKTHQQRRHTSNQIKFNSNNSTLPNYNHLSSYLVLPFSTKQFPLIAKNACEQQLLPLGCFTSKLYQCHICLLSFPCSRTLKYHFLNQHEQYEYKICQDIIGNLLQNIEFNLRTVKDDDDDDDDIESIKLDLFKQSTNFGLISKDLSKKYRITKTQQNHLIYPYCQHEDRTCANLCLQYLSSYSKLIQNYSYTITTIPKGNPFAQGSIVSFVNMNLLNNSSSVNDSNPSNEITNNRQKRKSIKQIDESPSPPPSKLKKKIVSNGTINNSKTNRVKIQSESITKTNETKTNSNEQSSTSLANSSPRKVLPKDNYIRSPSMSSNSSTSTRSSMTKSSSSSTNLLSQRLSSKRSLSPSITISLEEKSSPKRRRTREQKQKNHPSTIIRIDNDDIEQENGEDDDNNNNSIDEDILPIKFEQPKQRQASSGSIEYVQTLNNDQQLNNIENFKSKSKVNDEEIIICRSPPSVKKVNATPNKNHTRASVNGTRKTNGQPSPTNDEHVRVRCKICGEVLEGRSRFSQHVIQMHSDLLQKTNITESKQHQTTSVR